MNLHREKVGPLIGHLVIRIARVDRGEFLAATLTFILFLVPGRPAKMSVPHEFRSLEIGARIALRNRPRSRADTFINSILISGIRYRICCPLALSTSSCSSSSEWTHVEQVKD